MSHNIFSNILFGNNDIECSEIITLKGNGGKTEGIRFIEYANDYREYDVYFVPVGSSTTIKPDTGSYFGPIFMPNYDAIAIGRIFYGSSSFAVTMDGVKENPLPPFEVMRRKITMDGVTYSIDNAKVLFVRIAALMKSLGVTDILDIYRETTP